MLGRISALNTKRVGCLRRPARLWLCAAVLVAAPANLPGFHAQAATAGELASAYEGESIADFYAARGGEPLWLSGSGAGPTLLLGYLRTADADGLNPASYRILQVDKAIRSARSRSQVRKADRQLSEAFVAYVRDLKRAPMGGMIWVDPELKPKAPSPRQLLEAAAAAPSLQSYVSDMRWMNPIYAGLRQALVSGQSGADRQLLRLNLERARALPSGAGRYIIVNATAQRLTMHENGKIVDSMKVVVGKPKNPTPMMAALIRFASLNPYWYVPADLTAERIAPNVTRDGLSYLKAHGYQVMTDWADNSTIIDPSTIDWQAVADGTRQVWVRQLPGRYNAMGTMKFMFPNSEGVYLHDTPQKELLTEASRMFSGGCVRLEDAPRLGRWLFGKSLETTSKAPEQRVDLPKPVPVYITYFTVMPNGTDLATFPDIYSRDRDQLAQAGGQAAAAR